jgi:succinate-acetate transporter protein
MTALAQANNEVVVRPAIQPAHAVTLGLTGFAINFFIQTMCFTGWFPPSLVPLFIGTGYSLGAGMMWVGTHQFRLGDGFAGLVFTAFGAYWIGIATLFLLQQVGIIDFGADNAKAMGVFFIAWTLLTAFLLIGAAWVDMATFVEFAGLLITFVLFVLWGFGFVSVKVGAVVGLVDALGAFFLAGAVFVNGTAGRTIVPMGPSLASVLSRGRQPAHAAASPAA